MYRKKNNTFIYEGSNNKKDLLEIEIGDIKQPDFKPQVKFKRWDNEVNFSIRAEEHPKAKIVLEGKKIKYITPEYEVHQYDSTNSEEESGFEFEWILNNQPKSNILKATIQTKGLDFYYQGELTEEDIKLGKERPENIIGSYAVYA